MLKRGIPTKVKLHNPAADPGLTNRSPEEIPEVERRFKQQKRQKRPLPSPASSPEEKKVKVEGGEEPKAVTPVAEDSAPKVIPLLSSDDACDRLVAEGDCNPRSWTPDHVQEFLVKNQLAEAAKKLEPMKMDGDTLLKQNRQALGIRLDFKVVISVMKYVAMLRRIDNAYQEKRKPKEEVVEPLSASPPDIPALKRRVGDGVYDEILAKRKRYADDPEAYAREVAKVRLNAGRFPGVGGDSQRSSPGGSRKKICYKCKGEGHLGRECTQGNDNKGGNRSTSFDTTVEEDWGNSSQTSATTNQSQLTAAVDDDWDDDKPSAPVPTTPASIKPAAIADDDDWDSPSPAISSSVPNTPVAASTVADDDWDDDAPSASSTPLPTTTAPARSSWGNNDTRSSDSWSGNNRGGGRGGFNGGERGRGGFNGGGRGRGGTSSGPRVCFKCNKEGHISRDCTEPGGNGGGRGGGKKICYKCQEEGHLGRECSKPNTSNSGGRTYSKPSLPAPTGDDDWGSPPPSKAPSTLPAADDDDWDSPSPAVPVPTVAVTAPAPTNDDDWDTPSAAVSNPPQTSGAKGAVADDWSLDVPSPSPSFGSGRSDSGRGGGRGGFRGGRGGGSGPRVCFRCNKEGHISRDCSEPGGNGGGRGGGKKICYKCQEEGHLGRECSNPNTSNSGGGNGGGRGGGKKICYKCKGEGHLGRECTQGNETGGNRSTSFDTAVQEDWGNSSQTLATNQSQLTAAVDDDWDDVKPSAPAPATPASIKPAANVDDDDWDSPSPAISSAAPKAPVVSSTVADDDWDNDAPAASSTPLPTTAAPIRSSWGNSDSRSSDSWGGSNRGGGRGGFNGGGRGRGGTSSGPRVCFKCNKEGHISRDCTEPGGSGGGRGGGKKICYKCQEEGHLGRECSNPNTSNSVTGGGNGGGRGGGKKICYKCQEEGHLGRECSKPNTSNSGGRTYSRPSLPAPTGDDDWGSPPPSKAPSTLPAADDDDWDSPSPAVPVPTVSVTAPAPTNDDDWDTPSAAVSNPPQTSGAKGTVADDWSLDVPSPSPSFGSGRSDGGRGGGRGGFRGGRGGGSGPRVCFRCNKEGHISRDCSEPGGNSGGRGGGSRVCYKCQEEGHLSRDCPKSSGRSYSSSSTSRAPLSQSGKRGEDEWGSPPPSKAPSTLPAPDDDWSSPVPAVAVPTVSVTAPTPTGDDDWSTVVSDPKTTSTSKELDVDDWSLDTPARSSESGRSGNGRGSFGRGGGRGGGSRSRACYRCNKEGHLSRDCTERRSEDNRWGSSPEPSSTALITRSMLRPEYLRGLDGEWDSIPGESPDGRQPSFIAVVEIRDTGTYCVEIGRRSPVQSDFEAEEATPTKATSPPPFPNDDEVEEGQLDETQ